MDPMAAAGLDGNASGRHCNRNGFYQCFARHEPEQVRTKLNRTFARMKRGEFTARPEARRCRLCPVRFACCDQVATGN